MRCGSISTMAVRAAAAAVLLLAGATGATAACTIPDSACYPWRIEAGDENTVLLEIVPNNAATGVIYRICLCPEAKPVAMVFDFESKKLELGRLESKSGASVCRDYRIATARKSRLLLSRPAGVEGAIEGCYVTW